MTEGEKQTKEKIDIIYVNDNDQDVHNQVVDTPENDHETPNLDGEVNVEESGDDEDMYQNKNTHTLGHIE